MNVLCPIAIQVRLLSVLNIIQLIMSMFYASRHFPPCSYSEKQFFLR